MDEQVMQVMLSVQQPLCVFHRECHVIRAIMFKARFPLGE
jgi:hypothetical protein